MSSIKKYVAEFIGTFALVLFGCGVATVSGCNGTVFDSAYVGTAVTFGLVIVAMAYCVGNVSGCHINPAVSIAMLVAGKMDVKDFIGYVVAQFLGAIAGAAVLAALLPGTGLGANALFEDNVMASAIVEIILTFMFVLTILGVTSRKGFSGVAGLVIGGSLTLVHLLGIYFTGTSVNPARTFGPALFTGTLDVFPVFLIAPLVGGVLAALVWKVLDGKKA